jgi:hypothetical protein
MLLHERRLHEQIRRQGLRRDELLDEGPRLVVDRAGRRRIQPLKQTGNEITLLGSHEHFSIFACRRWRAPSIWHARVDFQAALAARNDVEKVVIEGAIASCESSPADKIERTLPVWR